MAREAVGAVDFLGLGRSLCERDTTHFSVNRERGKLVKPTPCFPASSVRSSGSNPAGEQEQERESSLSRLVLRTENYLSKSPSTSPKEGWPPSGAKEENMGAARGTIRTFSEKASKPLEDLTDTDIMHLTQEDCQDYLKGRGMHRNTWSKPQGQGVMTQGQGVMMARHFDPRQEEEKPASRSAGSPQKNGLSDTPTLAVSSGPGWQHDTSGPSQTIGSRANGFQPPRFSGGTTQGAATEDAHGGARPTERGPGPHIDSTSLTLSIPSTREQPPTTQSSGFGSPLPTTFLRMLKPPDSSLAMHGQRALQGPPPQPAFHAGSLQVGSVARSTTPTHLPGRPPTAQLTIFYSGTVNVYDDVPADKAQAIMLLAGNTQGLPSNFMSPPAAVGTRPASTGGVASSSSASAGPASTPTPSIPTSSGPVPAMLVASGLNKQAVGVATRTILHQELPQARKASLARFLEKRKDRVRGKSPYPQTPTPAPVVKKPEAASPPREKSPSPCTSKVRTRSPSPVNTAPNKKRSPSPAQRPGPAQSSGSETSSPSQRPGTPQKTTQPNPPEEQAAGSATWRRSKDEQADRGSQQQLQHSKEEKSEPMEEETGSPSQRH